MESKGTDTGDQQQPQGQEVDRHWIQKIRGKSTVDTIQKIIIEVYTYLTTSDFVWQSFLFMKKNLTESPCSTLLYIFLALFGFLPIICFFLFVCGTLILWLVCFIVCQAIAVTLAGTVCAGLFFFVVAACCIIASAFGMTIHTLSFMGQIYRILAFNTPDALNFLRQQLGKLGIHLRFPDDDQS